MGVIVEAGVETNIWRKLTFDQDKRALLREIPQNGLEGMSYAGAYFLLLIGENPENWPNDYEGLKKYGLIERLERLSKEVKSKINQELNQMLKIRRHLFAHIDAFIESLELQKHQMKMKHRCDYL